MRIERVLVPVDFSPPSSVAVNYGIALARKFNAALALLHVVQVPGVNAYAFAVENLWIEKEHREQAVRMLSALVAPEDQDDRDLQLFVKTGAIEDEISRTIDEYHADIVVMGAHGRGLFGRWLIGSVTQHLLRRVQVPILTVNRLARPLAFERLLFATDLSDAADAGFRRVLELAQVTHSTLVVVHAVDPPSHISEGMETVIADTREQMEQARVRLNGLAEEGARQKVKVETVLVEARAAEAIFKAAEDNAVDMIVIAVQEKGFIERTLLGATAERVIRESHLPVLSIPGSAHR